MAARLVERPTALQIVNDVWTIEWMDESDWVTGKEPENADGVCYGRQTKIVIRCAVKDAREQHYQGVVLHEIMHACLASNYATGQEAVKDMDSDDAEEYFVRLMSPSLLYVLKANPHVLKYLTSDGTTVR